MALDRQSIERRDFPIGRRGYEPEVVDEHLQRLADEIETLQRSAQRRSGASLAQAASEQVRAIVEAAERSVADMRASAESEAAEHVARVAEAADELRVKLEAAEREVTAVLTRLRDGVSRLHDDLLALQAGAAALGAPSEPLPPEEPEAEPPAAAPRPLRSVPQPVDEPEPAPDLPPAAAADADDDTEAARIVALDLAFSGTPREEADKIIAKQYNVADRAALLDEVYAAAGGA